MVIPRGLSQFGTDSHADGERQAAEHRSQGCHHDGPEAQQARLVNGFDRREALIALRLKGKVDHHDGVLLHNSDQKENPDERHDAEVGSCDQQGKDRADTCGGKRGEDG